LRLRSRGECLWHSFRSLAAYCSSSAHPRNICCVGFARMAMLAKFIRMRTARSAATASHPCVEHATEGINQYREQSLNFFVSSVLIMELCFLCQRINVSGAGVPTGAGCGGVNHQLRSVRGWFLPHAGRWREFCRKYPRSHCWRGG